MCYTLQEHRDKKLFPKGKTFSESATFSAPVVTAESKQKLSESFGSNGKRKLIVTMEAIHVGRTANFTYYTKQGLREGINSWTHPYNKPVITHHNQHSGEPIGRILSAEYSENMPSGREGLLFTVEITDPDAVEKVLDGRYQTVSIGASTDKVTCNICGTDRTQEWCEHWRGETYEGTTCHYTVGTTFGQEVSYVNVPADENAGNINVSLAEGAGSVTSMLQIGENKVYEPTQPLVNLFESMDDDLKNQINGLVQEDYKLPTQGDDISMDLKEFLESTAGSSDVTKVKEYIEGLNKDLTEANAALAKAAIKQSKLEEDIQAGETANQTLTEENDQLKTDLHEGLARRVVEMKISLRKADAISKPKDEVVAEYVAQSKEALELLESELAKELAEADFSLEPGQVADPTLPKDPADPKSQQENTTIDDAVNIMKGIFGGRNRKK